MHRCCRHTPDVISRIGLHEQRILLRLTKSCMIVTTSNAEHVQLCHISGFFCWEQLHTNEQKCMNIMHCLRLCRARGLSCCSSLVFCFRGRVGFRKCPVSGGCLFPLRSSLLLLCWSNVLCLIRFMSGSLRFFKGTVSSRSRCFKLSVYHAYFEAGPVGCMKHRKDLLPFEC